MKHDEAYEKAMEKIGLGEYEEAIKYLDEIILKDGNNRNAWIAKGVALMNMERYEETLKILDHVLAKGEDDFVLALKGVALYETGRDGSPFLEKSLEINPKNSTALYWKGVMAGRNGRKEEEAELKGEAAFIMASKGGEVEATGIFREVYYSGVDLPIRYECGIAYVAMLEYFIPLMDEEEAKKFGREMDEIIEECWNHRNLICKSARIVLDDMVGKLVEENMVVENEKDFVFATMFESWEVENAEEKEN